MVRKYKFYSNAFNALQIVGDKPSLSIARGVNTREQLSTNPRGARTSAKAYFVQFKFKSVHCWYDIHLPLLILIIREFKDNIRFNRFKISS